ncbi:MAG: hypothetical protein A3F16_01695 [Deltaproteobacteria bacterium RIFCSPHIGHO2_12_FULL_43_9]|nr:MAG: hypothetical protein A3F16_01695 [Deltaproteobacteria bacterium RIFCSPHIGHO2_12_FULL_43_9]
MEVALKTKDIAATIKNTRKSLGLSQIGLSKVSGVSLPTIQNMEAAKGNPTIGILESLLAPLGLKIQVQYGEIDWDLFVRFGLPMTSQKNVNTTLSPEMLINILRKYCAILNENRDEIEQRKLEALQALLLAIKIQFPAYFRKNIQSSQIIASFVPLIITGRLIELKRIAEERLSKYL